MKMIPFPKAMWADIGKAEQFLGWKPWYTFQEGMVRLVRWSQENREWMREVKTT